MKFLLLLFIPLFPFTLKAQKRDSTFTFRCKVLDKSSKSPIPFAHIYNESRRYGSIADSSGYFVTNVQLGDTLAFIVLGYLGKPYVISAKDSVDTEVSLQSRSYKIDEVSVNIPRTYKDFKTALMNVDPDKGKPLNELPDHNPYKTPQALDTNIITRPAHFVLHPVSAFYYKFSKEEESKRKAWYIQQRIAKQETVDNKYNRKLVTDITRFTGSDLLNFMGYCSFDFNYLYDTPQWEIIDAIKAKHALYLETMYQK